MKAVVLLSGGLDSSLALKLIADQEIEIIALHFVSSFCLCDGSKGCGSAARKISDMVGIQLKIIYLGESYLDIVENPRHGYGRNLNPCIDCRILKFSRAKDIMKEVGASFVVTGEVLGQRPMSQHKRAMIIIERESGLEDLVVRPLSAKMLNPSFPEREGWVNREALLHFCGRSRKPQMELASELGIEDYPCPAGGCLLTDSSFCRRMKDLLAYGKLDLKNVELLKIGRHFRLSPEVKLVVGRNEKENNRLLHLVREDDIVLEPVSLPGPTGLIKGICGEDAMILSSKIVARYTALDKRVDVRIKTNNVESVITTGKVLEDEFEHLRI